MSNSKNMPFSLSANFNTHDEGTETAAQKQSDKAFCIAMMGNFSGRQTGAEKAGIGNRHFIEIDRYNYDEVLASMALQLTLPLNDDSTVDIALRSLKDFQPDNLYKNVEVFSQLQDLRNRLSNPETSDQVIKEIKVQEESASSLLDSIMNETETRSEHSTEAKQSARSRSLVDNFIRQMVAGRKAASRDTRQHDLPAGVDEAVSLQMRNILHNPKFQALEAVWRAVHFMVRRIRSGKAIKLYLLDVSRDELALDLAVDDVTQSQLYQQFCDNRAGDISWNLIIGDFHFSADIDDFLMLSQLGAIAKQAGAQFISAADEKLAGCKCFAETPKVDSWQYEIDPATREAWALLRKSPVAKSISLALPRFLLRTAYGSKATPVKSFAFEEMAVQPEHEDYLWGNPAFIKAEQIARAFKQSGWDLNFANAMNTEDLPLHFYEVAGQTRITPCAEIPLTDTGAGKMLAQGLIPLWSVKNKDRIHSGDFHSIAE